MRRVEDDVFLRFHIRAHLCPICGYSSPLGVLAPWRSKRNQLPRRRAPQRAARRRTVFAPAQTEATVPVTQGARST